MTKTQWGAKRIENWLGTKRKNKEKGEKKETTERRKKAKKKTEEKSLAEKKSKKNEKPEISGKITIAVSSVLFIPSWWSAFTWFCIKFCFNDSSFSLSFKLCNSNED